MTESPSCYLVWVFLILTIILFVCGCVGCWHAAEETHRKRQGGDVEMQWNPRECRMEPAARPPPPPKRWSPEERRALARAVSGLPPSCLQDVRNIVGGDESTFEVAAPAGSLGVSISRRCTLGEVRASGPLAGRVAVGDRLVSIRTPGRALFTCGPTATGPDIVDELRAGAGSDGRVLTFARRGQGLLRELLPASCFDASPRRFFAIPVGIFVVALICFLVGGFFGGILLIFLSFPLAILSFGCCCCAIHCNPCAPTREDDIEARIRHLRAAAPRV